jgi:hypothetical protein
MGPGSVASQKLTRSSGRQTISWAPPEPKGMVIMTIPFANTGSRVQSGTQHEQRTGAEFPHRLISG